MLLSHNTQEETAARSRNDKFLEAGEEYDAWGRVFCLRWAFGVELFITILVVNNAKAADIKSQTTTRSCVSGETSWSSKIIE